MKYSSNSPSDLSEDTNTTSKSLFAALSLAYVSASFGVKPLQGGHHCAWGYVQDLGEEG